MEWQPSRYGTSRMSGEVRVRICERLGVKIPLGLPGNLSRQHHWQALTRTLRQLAWPTCSYRSIANTYSLLHGKWLRLLNINAQGLVLVASTMNDQHPCSKTAA